MSKLTKRKTIVEVGKRCPTNYEINKSNRDKAIEVAKNTPDEIKNKKIKYLLK
jgi:hypothetical protein